MDDSVATVYTLSLLQKCFADWKRQGFTVGWTNGCFDILHAGHVEMLRFAKRHCDRLIVGVNHDKSVRRLKGPGRPRQPLPARLLVLSALRAVDALLVLQEDTPVNEVSALRPDLAVKDDSYLRLPMPERDVVERYGGRVLFFPRREGLSTTLILSTRG